MKVKIHIPTVQFGFIEVEGEEKDIPKMIKLHNKYSVAKINEPKVREPNPYKGIADNYNHEEALKP